MSANGGSITPGRGEPKANTMDFAAGYAMGLIGGVKGWMEGGSRRRNLSDSRAPSQSGSDEDEDGGRSPVAEASRGRAKGKKSDDASEQLTVEMET